MLSAKNVHIIGIGGIGTSAVAKWFLDQGAKVSGSDLSSSDLTKSLEKRGVKVSYSHAGESIPTGVELVIYSRAVPVTNPERVATKERGITEWSYPQFLGELSRTKKTIAVSGTNGKSTTTAMTAKILIDAGLDPTVILGTLAPFLPEGNLRLGKSEWFVVEACEHMESMREISPYAAIITNIEEDHLDYYHSLASITAAFKKWIEERKPEVTFLNARDDQSRQLVSDATHDYDFSDRTVSTGQQTFKVKCDGPLGGVEIILPIPGEFNAMNATAAAHAGMASGVPLETIVKSLSTFPGTWRRFEKVGQWKEADVYSDYGHHPTAIKGTLSAFKEFFPDRRLVLVFEPHQHSRTHELFAEFVESFDLADVLIISEIYEVAGRTEEKFESSKDMADKVTARGKIDIVKYAEDHDSAESQLRDLVQPNDVIVIMGAGAIDQLARKLTT